MSRDYPESYGPVCTCFNCKYSKQVDGKHYAVCKEFDLIVGIWCKCFNYEMNEDRFYDLKQ